ncbi:YfiR/HmsC family protein [Hydrogenimonas sp.]
MTFRFLFLLQWIFVYYANAYIYNDALLVIYAKIVPKIMILDHTLRGEEHLSQKLCILYEKGDERVARKIARMMRKNVPETKRHPTGISIKPYGAAESCDNASAFFLLEAHVQKIERAIRIAREKRILTFSYDSKMLEYGVDISLHTGKKVYPIVNIDAVKEKGLRLDPLIFQVAKIHRRGAS